MKRKKIAVPVGISGGCPWRAATEKYRRSFGRIFLSGTKGNDGKPRQRKPSLF
ncbi:MAG: hypothetical protein UFG06_00110 [Lachnospiraceae bacterium]|nr:hypothetical protein [Lachnospiraceae bacterium]